MSLYSRLSSRLSEQRIATVGFLIDKDEEEALKRLATHLLSLTDQAVDQAHRMGELMEVDCNAKD